MLGFKLKARYFDIKSREIPNVEEIEQLMPVY